MSFFGLMTVKAHEAVVNGWADDLRSTHSRLSAERNAETMRANKLSAELAALKAERDGLLRDKLAESARAKSLAAELVEAMKAIEALRPDAEKHRERLRRDRDSAAAKRAGKKEGVA